MVGHRVTSPLLFGIRTEKGTGFSSQSEEMLTAFSILQTMTISPYQNLILNKLEEVLLEGGYSDTQLYFDQLTPLALLSQQADDTKQTISEVSDETNKEMENPSTIDSNMGQETEVGPNVSMSSKFFSNEYEITKY